MLLLSLVVVLLLLCFHYNMLTSATQARIVSQGRRRVMFPRTSYMPAIHNTPHAFKRLCNDPTRDTQMSDEPVPHTFTSEVVGYDPGTTSGPLRGWA